jgi:hypothetical protein
VTHFRVSDIQLEQLAKDAQPFLVHSVLRPTKAPPPGCDGEPPFPPLMIPSHTPHAHVELMRAMCCWQSRSC